MFKKLYSYSDFGLLLLRVVVGVIFIVHGMAKWSMWGMTPSEQMPGGMLVLMKILSIIEPLAGIALILGLFTQISALVLAVIMIGAIAVKIFVMKVGFTELQTTGWEFDLILLAANINLILFGGGKYALKRDRKENYVN
jgi:putative oxidoreductase